MIESLKARWAIIIAVFVLGLIWIVPNFVDTEKIWWPTNSKMVMGLDIQGGTHLVLRVDLDGALRQDATRTAASLPREIEDQAKINVKSVTATDPLRGEIRIELNKPEDAAPVQKAIEYYYGNNFRTVSKTNEALVIEYSELFVRDFRSKLLEQATSTIRNRIDEFGVAEPSITAQGDDRILVQLPGIKDASTAKDLINRTARLDFMMVHTEIDPAALEGMIQEAEKEHDLKLGEMKYSQYVDRLNEALKSKLPPNTVIYFEKPENAASMEAGRIPYLLKLDETVAGDLLSNAFVNMGEFGRPEVAFKFGAKGAQLFGDMTGRNVGKPMAIVLDKVVKSAPMIQSRITDSGRITLGGGRDQNASFQEAKVISTALRAGALPASLEQLEERTVGPTLGQDAIQKGQFATIIAGVLVFVFMVLYYKSFGFIADLALALNLFLTLAILSSIGATLTLPGVAGLALTLGMAVDANVIIFERVKEELRKGASSLAAIRDGYDRAFSAIFDSNITSIAVCIVLMYYGTGPVRGFAVTLIAGLVISMFSAIFFTRAILDLLVAKWKWNLSVK